MSASLRTRLFLTLAAVIAVSFAGLFWWLGRDLKPRLMAFSEMDMERAARLVAEEIGERPFSDSLADTLGRVVGLRVTLIDDTGRVRGDSEVPVTRLPAVENHATRPEVRAALAGRIGVNRRASETVSRSLLYLAVPHPRGVIRLARSTEEVDSLLLGARQAVVIAAVLALLLVYLASGTIGRLFGRRLRGIRARVEAVAHGVSDAGGPSQPIGGGRPPLAAREALGEIREGRPAELEALAGAIERMAKRVERRIQSQESERQDWQAMFDGLDGGLALVDAGGFVVRMNATFAAWVGRSEPIGQRITTLFRTRELVENLERGLSGNEESWEAALGDRSVVVSVRPYGEGALVLLQDLTQLRQLEGVRRDFVANVSHELKTPLTSIVGFAEAVAEPDLLPDRRREFAGRILANARRMRRLVDDLLDLARIESGRWEPSPEPVDLAEVARAVWSSLEPAPREGSVRLEVEPGVPCARADSGAVRQIFFNLFDNALRYAPRASGVRVEARAEGEWVRVDVSDTGPGIASAHLSRIFERFYRVDAARSRKAGGTGLGLAIVKHLVTAHGGAIGAESELGRGTTLWFTLPAVADPGPPGDSRRA